MAISATSYVKKQFPYARIAGKFRGQALAELRFGCSRRICETPKDGCRASCNRQCGDLEISRGFQPSEQVARSICQFVRYFEWQDRQVPERLPNAAEN